MARKIVKKPSRSKKRAKKVSKKRKRKISPTGHLALSEILWAVGNPTKLTKSQVKDLDMLAYVYQHQGPGVMFSGIYKPLKKHGWITMKAIPKSGGLFNITMTNKGMNALHDAVEAARAANPMTGVPGGGISECIEEMSTRPDVDDPGALCAWIARERGEFGWRSLPHIKRGEKKSTARRKALRSVMGKALRNPEGEKIHWTSHMKGGSTVSWSSNQVRAVIPGAQRPLPQIGQHEARPANIPGQFWVGKTGKGSKVKLMFHYRGESFSLGTYDTPLEGKKAAQHYADAAWPVAGSVERFTASNPEAPVVIITEDGKWGEMYEATKARRAKKGTFIAGGAPSSLRQLAARSGQLVVAEGPKSRVGPVTHKRKTQPKRKKNPKHGTNVRGLVAKALR